ncbi:hypothetical protein CKM354_001074400 [Cercospora kikuchii]|uniref:Ran-interacting Mog1 protein n=1 Tax=Cercospora kikuchii TaxID=84275 RepID=A0A9P3CRL3_9PEZI|nr:Ran GTPase-binding protein MOG1 [Cercospora kikuchii]GIZ47659.1 hypothetical protein CKM354_001074400 [Cercospora kikuchii]
MTSAAGQLSFKPVDLFGGAITAEIPIGWEDVSQIRQVPDTQEVFLHTEGFSSMVFDILERVENASNDDVEALKFHLSDIIDSEPDAAASTVLETASEFGLGKMPGTKCLSLVARVPAGEKMRGRANEPKGGVVVFVILVRLERVETDFVVSVNLPVMREGAVGEGGDVKEVEGLLDVGRKVRERVVGSLQVKDWGLFGEE